MTRQSTIQDFVVITKATTVSFFLYVLLFIQQQQQVVVSYNILPVPVRTTFDYSLSHRSSLHQVHYNNPLKSILSNGWSLSSSSLSLSSSSSSDTTTTTVMTNEEDSSSSSSSSSTTVLVPDSVPVSLYSSIDGVKVFGRLAEKYIALDSSGGQCCYSGCSNCEYRLPGGGYIMADQSSARPKWIPSYTQRNTNNNNHITKWSTNFFPSIVSESVTELEQEQEQQQEDTTIVKTKQVLTKQDFVSIIQQMEYIPPLGGPYVSASSGKTVSDTTIQFIEHMYDVISKGTDTISSSTKFSIRLKQLSNGDEGMTWQTFTSAFHIQQQ